MNEYDIYFFFDGFGVYTVVYAEREEQAEYLAIDKLAENGFDIREFGEYSTKFQITGVIAL